MIDLWRLHLLRELSVLGTISRVAETVNQTRPAVSQQLALLEKEIGTILFERSGRGVKLTIAGQGLVARASELFALMNEIESELAAAKGAIAGEVRIAAFGSVATTIVPAAYRELLATHPDLDLNFEELEPADGLKAAAAMQVDLALVDDSVSAEALAGSLYFRPLCVDQFAAVLPASHHLAGRRTLQLADLALERWALNRSANTYKVVMLNACHTEGFSPRIVASSKNIAATLELVRTSYVVTVLPMLALRGAMHDSELRIVPLRPILSRRIFVAMPQGIARRPAIVAVMKALDQAVPNFIMEPPVDEAGECCRC